MSESYTVDSAIADLNAADEPAEDTQPAAAAEETVTESPAEQVEEEPSEEPEEAGLEETEEEPAEPEKPAVSAPQYWSAEAKARFADLPADLQQVVLDQENGRETYMSKARQETAEARKKADAEFQNVSQLAQALAQVVPQAAQTFQDRWANIDWPAWADKDPEAAFKGKLQFEAEQQQLQQLHAARQQADAVQQTRTLEAEREQLKTLAPALADPKDGPGRQQQLSGWLETQGFSKDEIPQISARAAAVAYKAFLYDQAQASLKAAPPRKPAPKTAKPSAAPPGNSQQRSAQAQQNRFAQTGSFADAVALLNLRD